MKKPRTLAQANGNDYAGQHIAHKRAAQDANAWAAKLRADRDRDRSTHTHQPAPVVLKGQQA